MQIPPAPELKRYNNAENEPIEIMTLSNLGIILTLLYIGTIAILRFSSFQYLSTMPLNEFGDFFAGVFGPLMLLWVIISVYLQKSELGQNTEALKKQAEELEKSVEQHKDLVGITKKQLEIDTLAVSIQEEKSRQKENDFSYINSRSDRMVNFTLSEFDINEAFGETSGKVNDYRFSINLSEIISHLIEINKSEFELSSFKNELIRNCLILLQNDSTDTLNSQSFTIEEFEDIDKELLIFGLIRGEYVPEQRYSNGRNSSTSVRSAHYRYPLTEKLYQYRYWLELNEKYNENFELHYQKDE